MIYWFQRPLGTLSAPCLLVFMWNKEPDDRVQCSCHSGLVAEFLPGANEALVLPLALAGTLLACC